MPAHVSINGAKRKRTEIHDVTEVESKYLINEIDVEEIELCIEDLKHVAHKNARVQRVQDSLKAIHSRIMGAGRGGSVIWILKFVSSAHLKALMDQRNSIKKALLNYLMEAPEMEEYDFTEAEVELEISEEVLKECQDNLQNSKNMFSENKSGFSLSNGSFNLKYSSVSSFLVRP